MSEKDRRIEGKTRTVYQGYSICDKPRATDPYEAMMEYYTITGTFTGSAPSTTLLDELQSQAQSKVNEHLALHRRYGTEPCDATVGTPSLE